MNNLIVEKIPKVLSSRHTLKILVTAAGYALLLFDNQMIGQANLALRPFQNVHALTLHLGTMQEHGVGDIGCCESGGCCGADGCRTSCCCHDDHSLTVY